MSQPKHVFNYTKKIPQANTYASLTRLEARPVLLKFLAARRLIDMGMTPAVEEKEDDAPIPDDIDSIQEYVEDETVELSVPSPKKKLTRKHTSSAGRKTSVERTFRTINRLNVSVDSITGKNTLEEYFNTFATTHPNIVLRTFGGQRYYLLRDVKLRFDYNKKRKLLKQTHTQYATLQRESVPHTLAYIKKDTTSERHTGALHLIPNRYEKIAALSETYPAMSLEAAAYAYTENVPTDIDHLIEFPQARRMLKPLNSHIEYQRIFMTNMIGPLLFARNHVCTLPTYRENTAPFFNQYIKDLIKLRHYKPNAPVLDYQNNAPNRPRVFQTINRPLPVYYESTKELIVYETDSQKQIYFNSLYGPHFDFSQLNNPITLEGDIQKQPFDIQDIVVKREIEDQIVSMIKDNSIVYPTCAPFTTQVWTFEKTAEKEKDANGNEIAKSTARWRGGKSLGESIMPKYPGIDTYRQAITAYDVVIEQAMLWLSILCKNNPEPQDWYTFLLAEPTRQVTKLNPETHALKKTTKNTTKVTEITYDTYRKHNNSHLMEFFRILCVFTPTSDATLFDLRGKAHTDEHRKDSLSLHNATFSPLTLNLFNHDLRQVEQFIDQYIVSPTNPRHVMANTDTLITKEQLRAFIWQVVHARQALVRDPFYRRGVRLRKYTARAQTMLSDYDDMLAGTYVLRNKDGHTHRAHSDRRNYRETHYGKKLSALRAAGTRAQQPEKYLLQAGDKDRTEQAIRQATNVHRLRCMKHRELLDKYLTLNPIELITK